MTDYTIVVGVDAKHLRQLSWTWPTWKRHKPSLLQHPMLIFYDRDQISEYEVMETVDHPRLSILPWPPEGVIYDGDPNNKWYNPQRHKMFAGFLHVAAANVATRYWLKLDTDTIATGNDNWIGPQWFDLRPAIVAQAWHYTKPPDQMLLLDEWVDAHSDVLYVLADTAPLHLNPAVDDNKLRHKRIISWCGFFQTDFTVMCARYAELTCGNGYLPVPSQDGFMWYCAKRHALRIERVDMKHQGWKWCNRDTTIIKESQQSIGQ